MSTVSKGYSKYYLLCAFVMALAVTGYVFIGQSDAEPLAQDIAPSKSVSIPPPIEGLDPYGGASSKALKTAPLSILTSGGGTLKFVVDLAVTPEQQKKGLMFRTSLDKNTGMLFLFKESAERAFWMKDTLISLDMIFVRADGVIHNIHESAQPRSLERIFSEGPVKAVLELEGGEAERLGITIGDRLVFPSFDTGKPSE